MTHSRQGLRLTEGTAKSRLGKATLVVHITASQALAHYVNKGTVANKILYREPVEVVSPSNMGLLILYVYMANGDR